MKGAVIDWITPKGQSLNPHIPHNAKAGRGFNHERTGAFFVPLVLIGPILSTCLLSYSVDFSFKNSPLRTKTKLMNGQVQVAGDQWPVFLYANYMYDPEDPWNGLLCSGLLVSVSPSTTDQLTLWWL